MFFDVSYDNSISSAASVPDIQLSALPAEKSAGVLISLWHNSDRDIFCIIYGRRYNFLVILQM